MTNAKRQEKRKLLIRKIEILKELEALRDKRETMASGDNVGLQILKKYAALASIDNLLSS